MSGSSTITVDPGFDVQRQRRLVRRELARRSFALLGTASGTGRPHVAGILYAATSRGLFMSTYGDSVKARNVRENPRVAVSVPVRKVPVGPPYVLQFQTSAEVLAVDDALVRELVAAGELTAITGHGELELEGSVFLRLRMPRRVVTFGLGVPLWTMARRPLEGGRTVELEAA